MAPRGEDMFAEMWMEKNGLNELQECNEWQNGLDTEEMGPLWLKIKQGGAYPASCQETFCLVLVACGS